MSLDWNTIHEGDIVLYKYNNEEYPDTCPPGYYISSVKEEDDDGVEYVEEAYFGHGDVELGVFYLRNKNITKEPGIWFNSDGDITFELIGIYKCIDDATKYVTEHFPEYAI